MYIFSLVHISSLASAGVLRIHLEASAHRISNSWCCVGAVHGILGYGRVHRYQSIAQLSTALFPIPCPERTEVMGSASKLRNIAF